MTISVHPIAGSTKFIVVDYTTRDAYKYDAAGGLVSSHDLNREDRKPRGVAANKDGSLSWVVDAKGEVFVYNEAGKLAGSWKAKGVDKPEGIATDGTNLWIVDRETKNIFYFAGAASRRSGEVRATSRFSLDRDNRNPMDVTTDGVHLWVVNDATATDKVFRYSVGGQLEGSWSIDPANSQPTGLTIDPNDVNHVWIVDAGTDRVYQYDGAAGRTAGNQSATSSFVLAAANRNPQGIADPLPRSAHWLPPGRATRRSRFWDQLPKTTSDTQRRAFQRAPSRRRPTPNTITMTWWRAGSWRKWTTRSSSARRKPLLLARSSLMTKP